MPIRYALVQLKRARGDKTYYIRKYDTDTRKLSYISTKTTDISIANKFLSNTINNIQVETKPHTLADAFEAHLNTPLSPKTKVNIVQSMTYIKSLLNTPIGALKGFQFSDLVVPLDLANSTKKTLNRVYHGVLQTAIRRGWIEKNCLDGVRFYTKASPKKPEFWTLEEVDKIVNSLPAKYKVFGGLLAYQGLRMGEALAVTQESFVNGNLVLVGKTGNSQMPISNKLKDLMSNYDINTNIRWSTFKDCLSRTCKSLGIQGRAFPHKFRHSFISNLLLSGAPIQVASSLARHNKPTTTLMYYSHCLQKNLIDFLNIL